MTSYTNALFNVSLAGPTLFGHVISTAAQIAAQAVANHQQKYFVLLIITVRSRFQTFGVKKVECKFMQKRKEKTGRRGERKY